MRKLIFCLLISICFYNQLSAQKFFQSVSVTPYFYFEDVSASKEGWKSQLKSFYQPLAQNLDSLETFIPKDLLWSEVDGGIGLQLHLQKLIPLFQESSRSKLEWNVGVGHRKYKMHTDRFYKRDLYFPDTTQTYLRESENFQMDQQFVDVYNSIVYNVYGKEWERLHFFVGFGLQGSFSFSSKIKEEYLATRYQWLQGWRPTTTIKESRKLAAKQTRLFSFTIPVGWGIRLSNKIGMESGFEYINSRRSPKMITENYTEGVRFQLTFRYKL